jgi:hypothetical protein
MYDTFMWLKEKEVSIVIVHDLGFRKHQLMCGKCRKTERERISYVIGGAETP